MEVTINYNGQAVAVEVTLEVYKFLDRADHKAENLSHEQRRHWDGREFDEYIVATDGVGIYGETPEEYLCRMETLGELMASSFKLRCRFSHKCRSRLYFWYGSCKWWNFNTGSDYSNRSSDRRYRYSGSIAYPSWYTM